MLKALKVKAEVPEEQALLLELQAAEKALHKALLLCQQVAQKRTASGMSFRNRVRALQGGLLRTMGALESIPPLVPLVEEAPKKVVPKKAPTQERGS